MVTKGHPLSVALVFQKVLKQTKRVNSHAALESNVVALFVFPLFVRRLYFPFPFPLVSCDPPFVIISDFIYFLQFLVLFQQIEHCVFHQRLTFQLFLHILRKFLIQSKSIFYFAIVHQLLYFLTFIRNTLFFNNIGLFIISFIHSLIFYTQFIIDLIFFIIFLFFLFIFLFLHIQRLF